MTALALQISVRENYFFEQINALFIFLQLRLTGLISQVSYTGQTSMHLDFKPY